MVLDILTFVSPWYMTYSRSVKVHLTLNYFFFVKINPVPITFCLLHWFQKVQENEASLGSHDQVRRSIGLFSTWHSQTALHACLQRQCDINQFVSHVKSRIDPSPSLALSRDNSSSFGKKRHNAFQAGAKINFGEKSILVLVHINCSVHWIKINNLGYFSFLKRGDWFVIRELKWKEACLRKLAVVVCRVPNPLFEDGVNWCSGTSI